ncbi:MAG: sulfotransferase [Pseudomonadota bacterium]|nr:sulfotransferase [Pseudomonadota bacterium]
MLFERAALEDRLGQYDAAYADFVDANILKSQARDAGYDSEKAKKEYMALRNIFSSKNYPLLPKFSDRVEEQIQPIFIVGFPRSGTTLLEQILVSHSQVSGGDELIFISEIARQIKTDTGSNKDYPENLMDESKPITPDLLGKWHDYYLERVKEQRVVDAGSSWFTDKMPHNLEKLGLIHLLFPKAPIIHITRHPMDSCLSAFMANFARGHNYTASMESTASHYSQMMELAEHYKTELDMNYLQIRYEDILDDPEGKIKEVLEFVGLPWEDACLNFHESKRISKTASYAQVTQKLYTTSRYRYKNYYKHLEPLEPILHEAMQRFGYTFEPPETEG